MKLIVDVPGACWLDYDELKTIPAPRGTATWQPIAHTRAVDYVLGSYRLVCD